MKWNLYLAPYKKLKIDHRVNNYKALKRKHKDKFSLSLPRQWFLTYDTNNTNSTREQINKLGFIKIKNAFASKDTIEM
jgi:hypothetical protein